MKHSENVAKLASALSNFQKEMPSLALDREVTVRTKTGGSYTFKYATFKAIVSAAKPILAKNGLSFSQLVEEDGSVTTILLHSSGEYLSSTLHIMGEQTPQGIGSAISYAKRYSLSSILGIVADDDDDGNMASGNEYKVGSKEPKAKAPEKPWLNKGEDKWFEAINFMANGGDIGKILGKYRVNVADKKELMAAQAEHQINKLKNLKNG